MSKIVKGQKVWLVRSNRSDTIIKEVVVASVGRKYITIDEDWMHGVRFHLDTLRIVTRYSSSGRLYLDIQEYHDEIECSKLTDEIRKHFSTTWGKTKLSLDALRKISEIIKSEQK